MNGENSTPDLRITHKNLGCFFRNGPHSKNCFLIMGTIEQPDFTKQEGIEIYNGKKDVYVISGFQEIDKFLQESYKKGVSLALRDYYPWWAANAEKYDSGKIIFLDEKNLHYDQIHSPRIPQVFFDDNYHINEYKKKNKFICDIRDINTGNFINPEFLIDRLLFKVNAIDAIKDEFYFIKLIENAEKKLIKSDLVY